MHIMFCIGKIAFSGLSILVFVEATQTVIGRAFTSNKYVARAVHMYVIHFCCTYEHSSWSACCQGIYWMDFQCFCISYQSCQYWTKFRFIESGILLTCSLTFIGCCLDHMLWNFEGSRAAISGSNWKLRGFLYVWSPIGHLSGSVCEHGGPGNVDWICHSKFGTGQLTYACTHSHTSLNEVYIRHNILFTIILRI